MEHFEADNADRYAEAAEELAHALQSGVNAGAASLEQHGDFTLVAFAVSTLLFYAGQQFLTLWPFDSQAEFDRLQVVRKR